MPLTVPTTLTPEQEQAFQAWYRAWADKAGINPNPDDPRHHYDYRAAFLAGAEPQIDPEDGRYHWPSKFKASDHPNRFIDGVDTITGEPVQAPPPAEPRRKWQPSPDWQPAPTATDEMQNIFQQPGYENEQRIFTVPGEGMTQGPGHIVPLADMFKVALQQFKALKRPTSTRRGPSLSQGVMGA